MAMLLVTTMAGAKGKSIDMASGSGIGVDLVDGTSSKGSTAGRRSTATTDNPEVVCEDGNFWMFDFYLNAARACIFVCIVFFNHLHYYKKKL